MERALQNYKRATKETMTELLATWEVEREFFSSERRAMEESRTRLELEKAKERRARAALADLLAAVEIEREKLARERRYMEEDLTRRELETAEEREALESARTALAAEIAELQWIEVRPAWEVEREKFSSERRDLEEDRAALAAEFAGVEGMIVRPADRVQLNVGGKHFETTRRTLMAAMRVAPDSYFGAMFNGSNKGRMQRDKQGRFFIDRNGTMFEYILDFLRRYKSGDKNAAFAIHALPKAQMEAMREELNYYGLESAVCPPVPFRIDLATFSPGPDMLSERFGLGAVVLPENRGVLVTGGQDNDGGYLASTELFDLDSETFSPGPSMKSRRCNCAAAVMEDGRVVVVGETDRTSTLLTTEVLSPATNTWSFGPNMTSVRFGCAALPLSNSRILTIGGKRDFSNRSYLYTTEIIDLVSGTSTPGPEMSCSRYCCCAVMLHDGRVLVIGGRNSTAKGLSTTEVIDLTSGTSSPGPKMNISRRGASAVLLPEDGGVLVIGGGQTVGIDLATTEVLDVVRNTTSAGPKLGTPRSFCTAVKLLGNHILVIGGYSCGSPVYTSEILGMPA